MACFNIVLPFLPTKPVGGVKNLFQFANRLAANGHEIRILCSIKRPYKRQRTPVWLRWLITRLKVSKVNWFELDKSIKLSVVPCIDNKHVPDADATLSTWWQMAYTLPGLAPSKGVKVNFIQDYELWIGQDDKVHDSYKLPVRQVVIAKYLERLVERYSGKKPLLVNTPVDTQKFIITNPIEGRSATSVIMMYSEEPRKGTVFGIDALKKVKEKIPHLTVKFFSVYARPHELPDWIEFYRRPENLVDLYNSCAIFISPSLGEGWALPPAEAMACGCAVVCTDIGGHQDYAENRKTALLVEPQKPHEMADAILSLISDSTLRNQLAVAGHQNIKTSFCWSVAVQQLEAALHK